jgi:hypothetical protein
MKLRYTGSGPVTFADPRVGEVFPGQEFSTISDEEAAAFLTRADIEQVEEAEPEPAPKPARAKKEPEAPEVAETVG